MPLAVKICGLSTPDAVTAAVEGGAAFVGFVFFPPSPRCVTPDEAKALAAPVPATIPKVAVTVDADDATLRAIMRGFGPEMVQCHGSESPQRVSEIRQKFDCEVIKAVPVSQSEDLNEAQKYVTSANRLLFDAKPPEGADLPGGNALAFDWELIHGRRWDIPWLLAGGLNVGNLADAVRISGAAAVDMSSGVEDAPGQKNPAKISDLLALARGLG